MSATVQKDMPPWPQLSYALAQHIIEKNLHTGTLTATEAKQFESATVTFGRWVTFITDNTAGQLVSARVRALLFEQFIPHLYHSDRPCCRDARVDWDKIYETARSLPSPHPSPVIPIKEENTEADAEVEPSTNVSDADTEKVPLYDVYHTLEFDLAAMLELRKLEEFEAQEEMENDEEKDHAEESSLSLLNTHGNFNLKYLLQGIAANRHRTTLTDREIRNLLSDFKPHRTKWASDDKIGQEELYEACEKVLTDLKNYTEHSTPFLNKVSKREAPDYFDVIKRPMDLGTVTKKMKNLQYKSKKEFADDLYLIYDNCLTYNTNPASEYRKHAHAMRKKTDRLLARVPDITIRDRAEVEAEEFADDASEDGEHDPRGSRKGPGKHTHPASADKRAGSEAARGSRERSLTRESSAAPGNDIGVGSDNETGANTPNGVAPHKAYGGKQVKDSQAGREGEEEGRDIDDDTENDLRELQDQIWRDMTRKTRAKIASEIEKQYQFPFAERPAIFRSSLDMERFAIIEHQHCKPEVVQKLTKCPNDRFSRWSERNGIGSSLYDTVDLESSDDENLDVFFSRKMARAAKEDQEDSARTDLFLPEYVITSGLPEIPNLPEDIINDTQNESRLALRKASIDTTATDVLSTERPQGYTDVPLDVYPSVRFPNHGLNKLIDKNLKRLQKVRLVYSKCNAVRNNIPISTLASSIPLNEPDTSSRSSSVGALPWQEEGSDKKKIPPLIINAEAGQQLMQRTLVKLLAHAGFEGAQENALNVLTELAMDYMLTMGKTLRVYWDDYGRQMSGEEILMHVLYENGVDNVAELESYIRDDVERYGNRLDELHRKLENSYQDMLLVPNEKSDDESIIQDEESFITGSFGEELGEDYFGFKDIGLDQEYNVDALSIPARLWFGGNKVKEPRRKSSVHEPKLAYPPPPPFTPVSSETEFIGLLRPFIKSKMTDKGLVEDEYIPNKHKSRPKYPPTNKSNTGRKRPLKDGAVNSTGSGAGGLGGELRKTKRKRPLEEILAEKAERAEKKRQKMEEKAQKLAEKEEKRRLREELKEQERIAKQEAKERKAQAKRAATTTSTS